jgi:predicted house-cleaning noncanonical NTP pyrophosphatase (MazG superfamily)
MSPAIPRKAIFVLAVAAGAAGAGVPEKKKGVESGLPRGGNSNPPCLRPGTYKLEGTTYLSKFDANNKIEEIQDCMNHVERLLDNGGLCGSKDIIRPVIAKIRKYAKEIPVHSGSPSGLLTLFNTLTIRLNRLNSNLHECPDSSNSNSSSAGQQQGMEGKLDELRNKVEEIISASNNSTAGQQQGMKELDELRNKLEEIISASNNSSSVQQQGMEELVELKNQVAEIRAGVAVLLFAGLAYLLYTRQQSPDSLTTNQGTSIDPTSFGRESCWLAMGEPNEDMA